MGMSALPLAAPAAADPCQPYRDIAGNRTDGLSDTAFGTGPLRVFGIQFKQMVDYVVSYEDFDMKMECLMRDYVLPYLDRSKTNLVVFNEDIGLAQLATGTRGAAARAWAGAPVPGSTPETYDIMPAPTGAAIALGSVAAGYAKELSAYRLRFPDQDPRKAVITAATDTFVRGFMSTFSRIARRHDVWVVASNNQGDFRYSTDREDIAKFADPDLAAKYANGELSGVWVATTDKAWNNGFLWGPKTLHLPEGGTSADPERENYDPRTNLLFTNRKTPLTQIEKDFLALDEGDMSRSNTGPVEIPGLPGFRFGFAISLPAFMFGDGLPAGTDPCSTPLAWMRCLHERGVNTVIQPEANPGPWARYGADGGRFQSVTWGASTIRIVTDPSVPNFRYVVCPHMVGNLVDLVFDGQSAILERGRAGAGRSYVGAREAIPDRDGPYAVYTGPKPEFLALAPWVEPDNLSLPIAADRDRLHAVANELMAGSRSPRSNGYLETAIAADLTAPGQ